MNHGLTCRISYCYAEILQVFVCLQCCESGSGAPHQIKEYSRLGAVLTGSGSGFRQCECDDVDTGNLCIPTLGSSIDWKYRNFCLMNSVVLVAEHLCATTVHECHSKQRTSVTAARVPPHLNSSLLLGPVHGPRKRTWHGRTRRRDGSNLSSTQRSNSSAWCSCCSAAVVLQPFWPALHATTQIQCDDG